VAEVIEDYDKVKAALSGQFYDGEANLSCPSCGSDFSHVRTVFCRHGSDTHEGGGYHGLQRGSDTPYRRAAVVVALDCEGSCRWNLIIQQHKGVNLLQTEVVQSERLSLISELRAAFSAAFGNLWMAADLAEKLGVEGVTTNVSAAVASLQDATGILHNTETAEWVGGGA